jgi:hypothetical protein
MFDEHLRKASVQDNILEESLQEELKVGYSARKFYK